MKLAIFLIFMTTTYTTGQVSLSCEQLKALAKTDMDIWNSGEVDRLSEIYHQDVSDPGAGYHDLVGRKDFFNQLQAEISNLHVETTDLICGKNSITVFYHLTGYHNKYQMPLDDSGMYTAKVTDGKMHEIKGYFSRLGALTKGGYTLAPPPAVSREVLMDLVEKNLRMFNEKDLSLVDEIFSESFQNFSGNHLDYEGLDARKAWVRQVFDSADNLKLRNIQIILGHDSICQEWEATGYNRVYKTNFTTRGISLNRVKDGKIYWSSGIIDMLTPLTKAGYTLQPPK